MINYDFKNSIKNFLKNISNDEDLNNNFRFWEIGTKPINIINQFILEVNSINLKSTILEVVLDKKILSGKQNFYFRVDKKLFTCSSRKNKKSEIQSRSRSATRQYLQVLSMSGLLLEDVNVAKSFLKDGAKFTINTEKLKKFQFSDFFKNIYLDFKRALKDEDSRNHRSDFFFSLIIALAAKKNWIGENLYNVIKSIQPRKKDGDRNSRDTIQSSLIKTYDQEILQVFEEWMQDNRITLLTWFDNSYQNVDQELWLAKREIKTRVKQARNRARNEKIRDYEANGSALIEYDLKSEKTFYKNLLEVAHIYSFSNIKNEIDILLDRSYSMEILDGHMERIDKLISMISDKNNLLLIPFTIHRALDKKYLKLDKDFFFRIINKYDADMLQETIGGLEYELIPQLHTPEIQKYIQLYLKNY